MFFFRSSTSNFFSRLLMTEFCTRNPSFYLSLQLVWGRTSQQDPDGFFFGNFSFSVDFRGCCCCCCCRPCASGRWPGGCTHISAGEGRGNPANPRVSVLDDSGGPEKKPVPGNLRIRSDGQSARPRPSSSHPSSTNSDQLT